MNRKIWQCYGIKWYKLREVTENRQYIIMKNKRETTCMLCMLIDVAIPADRNVVQKEAQKKSKYNSLCTEIQRMWNTKCVLVQYRQCVEPPEQWPKVLENNLGAKAEKHSVDSVHKTAVFGTAHIVWNVLQCDTESMRCGDRPWFERRSVRENRRVSRDNNNNN